MSEIAHILPENVAEVRPSRRAFISCLGLLLVSPPGLLRQAAPSAEARLHVQVAPPTISRIAACVRQVSVSITVAGIPDDTRYDAFGEIWEADEPDGESDFCCELAAQPILSVAHGASQLLLTGKALAAELGVVKGFGPALDETDSADLVELFARIWLRDHATGEEAGPWQSPWRSAVASGALDWSRRQQFPGSILAPSRGGPPQACTGFGVPETGVSMAKG